MIRAKPNVLIVATRHGFVMANAGIDQSNLGAEDHGRRVLLLPQAPDDSARALKERLDKHFGVEIGVILSDSVGRAWRMGTVGLALGAAGLPSLYDRRGETDLFGRQLLVTETGFADEIAAAAGLSMGQADEAVPMVLVRGLAWSAPELPVAAMVRARTRICFDEREPGFWRGPGFWPRPGFVALSGGIGGAKLALGLYRVLPPGRLIIVNTGDDFEHLGLHHLPGHRYRAVHPQRAGQSRPGWGRRDETWTFMRVLALTGRETWFLLGDGDLALHALRTERLAAARGERGDRRGLRSAWRWGRQSCR